MRLRRYPIALCLPLVAFVADISSAVAGTSLAAASDRWFRTDHAVRCVGSRGRPLPCVPNVDTTIGTHVDASTHTALVFATYLPDPTGNGIALAAATFREGPDGWTLAGNVPPPPERAPDKVTFRNGVATFTAEAFRPGDARCCPSGRKAYRIVMPGKADVPPVRASKTAAHPEPLVSGAAASGTRRAVLDPARIIADQIRRERTGNMTGLLTASLRAAYDAVPRDEDNLSRSILGYNNDMPDKVVRVSPIERAVTENVDRASVKATLHYTNEDAPIPSFNRSILVDFAEEGGEWRIDNIRHLDQAGRPTGLRGGLKQAFGLLNRSKTEARFQSR